MVGQQGEAIGEPLRATDTGAGRGPAARTEALAATLQDIPGVGFVRYISLRDHPTARETDEDSEHVFNWDFAIEAELPRTERKIAATLQFEARDGPLPEEDPWAT